jgi:hypothetical protein
MQLIYKILENIHVYVEVIGPVKENGANYDGSCQSIPHHPLL